MSRFSTSAVTLSWISPGTIEMYASHAASIAWNLMQFWENNQYALVITGNWAPEINKGFLAPMFAYVPGQKWRFEGGPIIYWSGYKYNRGYYDKDSILIRTQI